MPYNTSTSSTVIRMSDESQSNRCFDIAESSPEISSAGPSIDHCWSICNIENCTGNWVAPNSPWIAGAPYGPFAFQSNPLNPSWTGTWTANSGNFNAFYNWVVSQVGNINVGDTIIFDMLPANGGMCNILGQCANKLCFKYEGYLNWNNGFGWAITSGGQPVATLDNCCPSGATTTDCLDCEIVVCSAGSNMIRLVNPVLQTSIVVTDPLLGLLEGEFAKRGDKFWKKCIQTFQRTQPCGVFDNFK